MKVFKRIALKKFVCFAVVLYSFLGFEIIGSCESVVLITGASRGIGASIADRLARDGRYTVFAGFRDKHPLEAESLHSKLKWVNCDVTNPASVKAAIQHVLNTQGRIDVLVNNAGNVIYGSHENVTIEEAKDLFEVNYFGVLRLIQAVLPTMRNQKSGRIIQIGSRAGFRPLPSISTYSDAKAAILSASETLAATLKPWNIKVSVVEPGPVTTDIDANAPYGSALSQNEDPYREIFGKAYLLAPPKGSTLGANAQSPEELAELVQAVIEASEPNLRYQTTDAIKAQAAARATDNTGNKNVEELTQILQGH